MTTAPEAPAAQEPALRLHVSPHGDDGWSGRRARVEGQDGPFASLERARDEIRRIKAAGGLPEGGVTVELAAGRYQLAGPLELGAEDSGTPDAPITYQAGPGAEVRVLGARRITAWKRLTDPSVLKKLDQTVHGKVYQADLLAHGVTDYGGPGGGGLELFLNDEPMTLARWPNEGFVKIADVLKIDPVDVRGTKGDRAGKFVYDGDRPRRWKDEKELWLHGSWFWDWSDQRLKVESIDTEARVISLAPPQHGYGYRKGQWYYALNALSEIDSPGEWYLDRESGILYFYPPSLLENAVVLVSVLPQLIKLDQASHVSIQGLVLEGSRGTAVTISGATGSRIAGCTIRNTGGQGVNISGGSRCSVIGCDIYQTAGGGIRLNGGDRRTLTPAGHLADNNHIHDFARWYRMHHAGVHVYGVGNRVSHNLIHDAPHTAIFFGGNDHVIELNEIHSVCLESNDAGAIYAGRNWTMRGTVIRHNYLHHINGHLGRGCMGIYLDDMFCGTQVTGNVFYKVTRAAFIGGGRDISIENNIFVDCNPSLHVDARAMGWAGYHSDGWVKELTEKRTHLGIPLLKSPYIDRYPRIETLVSGDPYAPEGNLIARNIHWGGRWDEIETRARPMLEMADNLLEVDPQFVDAARHNYALQKSSPAWDIGFEPIPFGTIGLYADELRASWPDR